MAITRRSFLAASAIPLMAGVSPRLAATVQLGEATLQTVSDGHLQIPISFQFGNMPDAQLAKVREEHRITGDRLEPECNLALYRDGTNTVIFDTGAGPNFMPTAGKIVDSLDAVDLSVDDVTHVVFTHAHPDHIWGLLDDFDEPLFLNAVHMMGRVEWDYWWNPNTVNTIESARQAFAVGAKRRMEVIEDSVELFDPEQEILPGIFSMASYGHTPGHMCFEIRNGSESAMVLGDAINNHHVAFTKPRWHSGADQDANAAAVTRVRLLQYLSQQKMAVLGFHLPDGGIGRVDTADENWRFVSG